MFHDSRFMIGVVTVFLLYSVIASFFSLTMFLQPGLGLSPFAAGLVFTPTAPFFFTGSLVGPKIAGHIGNTAPLTGAAIFAASIALTAIAGAFEPHCTPPLIVSLILNGFGQELVIPLATNVRHFYFAS
ncbi:MFS transporter [Burkholderia sp. WAC0059]|uniref:MFS transporter n=1 Tax=Burkholderia sp. WAC0059 TaxID=2066022 RepID=UPI0011AECF06|nr:MFS transporter [Burkholderia sp. WAC0059]